MCKWRKKPPDIYWYGSIFHPFPRLVFCSLRARKEKPKKSAPFSKKKEKKMPYRESLRIGDGQTTNESLNGESIRLRILPEPSIINMPPLVSVEGAIWKHHRQTAMTVQHPPTWSARISWIKRIGMPLFWFWKNLSAPSIYPCVFEKFLVVSQVFGTTIEIILSRTSTSFISFK